MTSDGECNMLLIRITYRNELNQNRIKVSKQSPDAFYVSMIPFAILALCCVEIFRWKKFSFNERFAALAYHFLVPMSMSLARHDVGVEEAQLHLLFILYSFIRQVSSQVGCSMWMFVGIFYNFFLFSFPNIHTIHICTTHIQPTPATIHVLLVPKNSRTHLMNKNLIRNIEICTFYSAAVAAARRRQWVGVEKGNVNACWHTDLLKVQLNWIFKLKAYNNF